MIYVYHGGTAQPSGHAVAGTDSVRVKQLLDHSNQLAEGGKIQQANTYLHRAEIIIDSLGYDAGRGQVVYTKANILLIQRRADSAETVLAKGIEQFSTGKIGAQLYSLLGSTYALKGKNGDALHAYNQSIALIDSAAQPINLAGVKLNVADSYYDLGRKGDAFRYYRQAVSIAEQASDSLFLAVALNNIGNTYNKEENYEKAAYYLQRAIDVSKAAGFHINQLRAITNMGNTRKGLGQLDKALAYYGEAMKLSKEVRPHSPPAILLNNIGTIYLRMGKLNDARQHFNQSLKYSRKGKVAAGIFYNTQGLSRVAEKRGDLQQAISWSKQQLEAARQSQNPVWISQANQRLYNLNKQQGYYRPALVYLESHKAITDSLNKRRYRKEFAENEAKLEVARQNKINRLLVQRNQNQDSVLAIQAWLIGAAVTIILLLAILAYVQYRSQETRKKAIRLLKEKRDSLESLNHEKDQLFALVAHDIRNPMSAMKGMLYLLRTEDLSESERQQMLGQLEIAMAQNLKVMENLLAWAQQQLSGLHITLTNQNVKELVDEQLTDHQFEAEQKEIAMSADVPRNLQAKTDANLLTLVLRNLIGNAIKFTEEGGQVQVVASQKNNTVQIQVIDDGIGIPAAQQQAIFSEDVKSRAGTQNEKGNGLGLNLCREFVEAQGGEISFKSEQNKGTTFTVTLPAAG